MTTMDFFGQQRRARKKSYVLAACLMLAVAVMIAAIYLVLILTNVLGWEQDPQSTEESSTLGYGIVTIVTSAIFIASGMFCFMKVRDGEQQKASGHLHQSVPETASTAPDPLRQIADASAFVCGVIMIDPAGCHY